MHHSFASGRNLCGLHDCIDHRGKFGDVEVVSISHSEMAAEISNFFTIIKPLNEFCIVPLSMISAFQFVMASQDRLSNYEQHLHAVAHQ